jgi:Flp pilus assembly protein TadG
MLVSRKASRQKGQSLIYVAILIVVLISGVFFVFDIGNMVNTKIKLQNGADAAALSAVAVKISKHHTDTLVRASMYHESVAAQANLRAAQATLFLLLNAAKSVASTIPDVSNGAPQAPPNLSGPGGPNEMADKYINYTNRTYRHVTKLHRERLALEGYYDWMVGKPSGIGEEAEGVGRRAILEAARIGFRANTLSLLPIGDNIKLFTEQKELEENVPRFGAKIGGMAYGGEGATKSGDFGQTFVEFDGKGARTAQGNAFLNYRSEYIMTTNAAAKIASTDDLDFDVTILKGLPLVGEMKMLWYSPRLKAIEPNPSTVIH